MNSSYDRRRLFRASAAAVVALGLKDPFSHALAADQSSLGRPVKLEAGDTILFQGDSITDAGRDRRRNGVNDPRGFGSGYPMMIASGLLRDYPANGLQIFNRGISGNKVPDLAARWQQDCIDLEPNLLSILIGVNDIWHKRSGKYDGTVESFHSGLTELLIQTTAQLPETTIVICEPFVLRCGAIDDSWFPEFTERREAARKVADSLSLRWVPFQEMFDEAVKVAEPKYWAGDGVHPTMAGHALMAKTWRETLEI
ncbi:GDSL-like Lipase/Acylhydrolase [Planctomycetes bacterium CA13]|uniref:GDSL-like Lipase/Acylhydrolase n=1 Tax=Novipirellula herctigrandis TaxID=2527986 RepID=A0A5C5YWN5_9BACT|nr:GDSL-like Lipase/Acylhydrolase [Planctomycetes bacterium CA13]